MNFDYCTTASIDFVMLDEATFGNILQVNLFSCYCRVNSMLITPTLLYLDQLAITLGFYPRLDMHPHILFCKTKKIFDSTMG